MSQTYTNTFDSIFVNQIVSNTFGQPIGIASDVVIAGDLTANNITFADVTVDNLTVNNNFNAGANDLIVDGAANIVTILANNITDVPIHNAVHTSNFSASISTGGQFMCVHHSAAADAMGFCFGPDPDEVTGDFNFLVNDNNTNAVLLASNVASVITPMMSADKTTGLVSFPGNIQSDQVNDLSAGGLTLNGQLISDNLNNRVDITNELRCPLINQLSVAGIQLGSEMLIDNANTRVDINNTLRCDLIDSITGVNGVVIDNTLAVNNSTNVVDIAVGSTLRSDNITSLSSAGIAVADSINIANTKQLKTNTIDSFSGAGITISDSVGIASGKTLFVDTINSGLLAGIEVIDTLAVGTSTQPANVSDSVVQIKAKSGATYGNPVTSGLIYCDSDDVLKTKNAAGNVVSISGIPSYASFFRLGNGVNTAITTADTWTIADIAIGTNVASGFSIANSVITYTGTASRNLKFIMSGSILTGNNNLLVGIACARNGTFNGSNELTSSIISGSAMESSINTAGQQGCLSSCFTSPCVTNDTFTILVKNATSTDDIALRVVDIFIETFTAGTD